MHQQSHTSLRNEDNQNFLMKENKLPEFRSVNSNSKLQKQSLMSFNNNNQSASSQKKEFFNSATKSTGRLQEGELSEHQFSKSRSKGIN